jgi:hypothetical protein
MGIFDNGTFDNVPPPSGAGANINPGSYLVSVVANRFFTSRKSGDPTFVMELKVEKTLLALDAVTDAAGKLVSHASNKEGATVSSVKVIGGQWKDLPKADVVAFTAAVLDQDYAETDGADVEKVFADDGKAFVGTILKLDAIDKPTKSGSMFTNLKWSQPHPAELKLISAGSKGKAGGIPVAR